MTDDRKPCVHLLASGKHGTFYVGVTSNLLGRLHQHRAGLIPGFTSRYGVVRLIYFEQFADMAPAITREKRLKTWNRDWKVALIEGTKPEWVDLAIGFGFDPVPRRGAYGSPLPRG